MVCNIIIELNATTNRLETLESNLNIRLNETDDRISEATKRLESNFDRLESDFDAIKLESDFDTKLDAVATVEELEMLESLLNTSLGVILEKVELIQQQMANLNNFHLFGITLSNPAASCADILNRNASSPSGYYWIGTKRESSRQYCNMTLSCGGVNGGWMRVAELDMTNSSHQCPSGLRQRTNSGKSTCAPYSNSKTCSSTTIPVNALDYSKVCGRIIGYQYGSTNSFGYISGTSPQSIDTYYVDGVSLTHGNPRNHIWTFAAADDETNTSPEHKCPCTNTNTASTAARPPAFVGNDYFCDTGSSSTFSTKFYPADPLWDGAGCGPLNTCCSFNNPPWFYKQLPQSTTDNIEMRVCRDQEASNEDIALEMIDIFVQ